MDEQRLAQLRKKTLLLPQEPGVYLMKDKSGTIIYVGKAKSLKNRVSSYFRSVEKCGEQLLRMQLQAAS